MMPIESEMDNILVRQKDQVIALCNASLNNEAYAILKILEELWMACGYGYKLQELHERVAAPVDAYYVTRADQSIYLQESIARAYKGWDSV